LAVVGDMMAVQGRKGQNVKSKYLISQIGFKLFAYRKRGKRYKKYSFGPFGKKYSAAGFSALHLS
jgi:hypothetical protein